MFVQSCFCKSSVSLLPCPSLCPYLPLSVSIGVSVSAAVSIPVPLSVSAALPASVFVSVSAVLPIANTILKRIKLQLRRPRHR